MSKIILIGPAYPLRGGIAAFTERLATELMTQGNDVTIESFSLQYPKILFPGKTQYTKDKNTSLVAIQSSLNSINPFSWIRLGNKIRKQKPDIVIFKFWIPFMAPALGTLARIIKRNKITKCIAVVHNILPHEKKFGDRVLANYFVKPIDGFLVLSDSVRNDLKRFDSSKPIRVSPHPLYDHYGKILTKTEARQKLELEQNWNYLLFFGFIREYKGLDLALKALSSAKLKDLKIKLIVAGEFYTNSKPYLNLVRKLELENRIIFRSEYIPDNLVSAYFSAADLIIQPYKEATQSGVTQIAYHFNKPILVTNVGGLSELVPHQKVGYISGLSEEEMADYIVDFYVNNRETEFSEAILKLKRKYSWNLFVEQLEKLIQELNKK
jgi:glycosyltransferase involved in cell wall biosynthesis